MELGKGEEGETGMPGVHFPPNEKQVTVHCKAIWIVGTGERKKREEGKVGKKNKKKLSSF